MLEQKLLNAKYYVCDVEALERIAKKRGMMVAQFARYLSQKRQSASQTQAPETEKKGQNTESSEESIHQASDDPVVTAA